MKSHAVLAPAPARVWPAALTPAPMSVTAPCDLCADRLVGRGDVAGVGIGVAVDGSFEVLPQGGGCAAGGVPDPGKDAVRLGFRLRDAEELLRELVFGEKVAVAVGLVRDAR